jgi:hypothetical protein
MAENRIQVSGIQEFQEQPQTPNPKPQAREEEQVELARLGQVELLRFVRLLVRFKGSQEPAANH